MFTLTVKISSLRKSPRPTGSSPAATATNRLRCLFHPSPFRHRDASLWGRNTSQSKSQTSHSVCTSKTKEKRRFASTPAMPSSHLPKPAVPTAGPQLLREAWRLARGRGVNEWHVQTQPVEAQAPDDGTRRGEDAGTANDDICASPSPEVRTSWHSSFPASLQCPVKLFPGLSPRKT